MRKFKGQVQGLIRRRDEDDGTVHDTICVAAVSDTWDLFAFDEGEARQETDRLWEGSGRGYRSVENPAPCAAANGVFSAQDIKRLDREGLIRWRVFVWEPTGA